MPEIQQRRRKQERWQNGFYHHGHAEKSIGADGRQKMEVIKWRDLPIQGQDQLPFRSACMEITIAPMNELEETMLLA
jgi:hypothetical protein